MLSNALTLVPEQVLPVFKAHASCPKSVAESMLWVVDANVLQASFDSGPFPCAVANSCDSMAPICKYILRVLAATSVSNRHGH